MIAIENTTTTRRSELSAEKQALLEKRLRGGLKSGGRARSIPRRIQPGGAPLSFAQQRLWFLDQLEPDSALYNLPTAVRLRGPLNQEALECSLAAMVERHEALRTRFVAEDGSPVQVIAPPSPIELPVIDLSARPEAQREAELQQQLRHEARRAFDLSRDLLMRPVLLRLAETEHVLMVTMHHIVSDAWSLGVFFRDLTLLYEGFCKGLAPSLPPLLIQYADYAVWQRQWMQGETMEKELGYWKRPLSGSPYLLALPADRPRPAVQTFDAGHATRLLPKALAETLKRLSQAEGATLFMTLLAAFKILLYRYTGQLNLVVGSPIAGRNQLETEALIGFFVNTLTLHTDLSGNPTVRQVISRVRHVTLEAYAHQDLPFERLVEELQPVRSSGYTPLVQVLFVLQSEPARNLKLPGLDITHLPVNTGTSKFDLTLAVEERADGLLAVVEYSADLFTGATIGRVLGHFQTLLEGIATNPAQRVSDLLLLTDTEQRQMLVEWNDTSTDYPKDKTLAQLFEEQAGISPDAVAVVFDQQQLTYGELNARANQLAHHLQQLGVGPDELVAVCMERSLEMIVALLGILKAGGAYVSLDPTYPRERLAFMLEDARAPVLLTQEKLRSSLPGSDPAAQADTEPPPPQAAMQKTQVVCLDTDWAAIARESLANPPNGATAENLAYVSFTSGSTGRPKGVCVPQRGVVRLVRNTNYARFTPEDVFLQLAPIAFDASTLEIWGALLNGARLVVFPPGTPTLAELGEFIERHRVTTLWLTAGLFQQMVEEQLDSLRHVRLLLAGGDVLSVAHVKQALAALNGCQLINGYGPTENTTFTCCHRITAPLAEDRSIPIGRPISNTQVYVLDEHLQPVPIGVPGELYIGGHGLARGYLNRPELTAARFVCDPFSKAPLYKTGDLVRWLEDGALEFLGRIDLQVKIRGFRVELGEIEAVLSQHPAVRECVVSAHPDTTGGKQLVAYCVPHAPASLNADELRQSLRQKLPDYMVPAAFVPLESLPLTPNGKVDRKALPAPDRQPGGSERTFMAPGNEVEKKLAKIWESVLGIQPVGAEDHFFDLGGHSLLAVRLIAQIEKVFRKKIPVATVFQLPTVAQLAKVVLEDGQAHTGSSLVEIQSKGSKPPLFFVHGVGGGMFWGYTNLSRYLGPDQPVYAFKSRSMDGLEEYDSIEKLAAQYVADLRAFQPHGPYHLGGYCFGGNVAYEMARQLHAQDEKVAMLALMNCAPTNSSYTRVVPTPVWFARFLRNLCYLIGCFCSWNSKQQREFIRWKARLVENKFRRLFRRVRAPAGEIKAEEVVDLSSYSSEQRKLWDVHIRALMRHRTPVYPGRVTLFRCRGHQLFCSFDPAYGWRDLATGGVTVQIVPGAHESILEEPHVQSMAEALKNVKNCYSESKGIRGDASMNLVRFLLRTSPGMAMVTATAALLSGACNAGLIALVNTALTRPDAAATTLVWSFVALGLGKLLSNFVSQFLLARFSQEAIAKLRRDLVQKILEVPLRHLEEIGAPRLMVALVEDVMFVAHALQGIPTFAVNAAILFAGAAYLGWLSWTVLLGMFGFILVGALGYRWLVLTGFRHLQHAREEADRLFGHFRALIEGIKELKLHRDRRGKFLSENVQATTAAYQRHNVAAEGRFIIAHSWGHLLVFTLLGLILFVLPALEHIGTKELTGYVVTTLYLMGPLAGVMGSLSVFSRANVALQKIEHLGVSLATHSTQERSITYPEKEMQFESLELADVTHSYHQEKEDSHFTLGPIHLAFRPGELVFLVGGNGGGKSTLAKIITGLYPPETGEIRLNGKPITDQNRDDYRQLFSAVFSDFYLFESFLGLNASNLDVQAQDYLVQLHLHRKVKVRQGVLSTTDLSHGQRKRLALLTAYLEDRPFYLFDEWASDQDPQFKEIFYTQLLPELKARGKTALVITHDDRFFHVADRIIKFDYGKLVYEKRMEARVLEPVLQA